MASAELGGPAWEPNRQKVRDLTTPAAGRRSPPSPEKTRLRRRSNVVARKVENTQRRVNRPRCIPAGRSSSPGDLRTRWGRLPPPGALGPESRGQGPELPHSLRRGLPTLCWQRGEKIFNKFNILNKNRSRVKSLDSRPGPSQSRRGCPGQGSFAGARLHRPRSLRSLWAAESGTVA